MVVFTGLEFGYKPGCCFYIGNNSVFEFPYCGLVSVAAIEEDHFLTTFLDEIMNLSRREVFAPSNDSVLINSNFICDAKSDNFITHADDEPWKIFNITVGPFEINILKRSIFASSAYVLLHCGKRSANGSINAVTRNDDASIEPKAFAERTLP